MRNYQEEALFKVIIQRIISSFSDRNELEQLLKCIEEVIVDYKEEMQEYRKCLKEF